MAKIVKSRSDWRCWSSFQPSSACAVSVPAMGQVQLTEPGRPVRPAPPPRPRPPRPLKCAQWNTRRSVVSAVATTQTFGNACQANNSGFRIVGRASAAPAADDAGTRAGPSPASATRGTDAAPAAVASAREYRPVCGERGRRSGHFRIHAGGGQYRLPHRRPGRMPPLMAGPCGRRVPAREWGRK